MRQGYAISLAVVGVVASAAVFAVNSFSQSSTALYSSVAADHEFNKYVSEFGKSYGTKEEFAFRSAQFKNNFEIIMNHNSMNENTYQLGLNKFADYTQEEYTKLLGYKNQAKRLRHVHSHDNVESETYEAGQYADWRT